MTKAQHQLFAMVAALRVRVAGGSEKNKARRDCLSHLRASLRPVAAERAFNNATQES